MTTYATAERARQKAIAALRAAGMTEEADRLAACLPITDRETAAVAYDVAYAAVAYATEDAAYATEDAAYAVRAATEDAAAYAASAAYASDAATKEE